MLYDLAFASGVKTGEKGRRIHGQLVSLDEGPQHLKLGGMVDRGIHKDKKPNVQQEA